ncbi:hypothetical protein [Paenibacillus glycinis]|uniref:Uncharacterized protein n=1 Tax=Paenibacillus glycinis TaxID=2697035 RepID=A0ABW9XLD6_9BACL|nr:hypothetical protein [Paenibacillus glycinis]NBD23416.1 hypothetical protein [Paenibacillus glycinis]
MPLVVTAGQTSVQKTTASISVENKVKDMKMISAVIGRMTLRLSFSFRSRDRPELSASMAMVDFIEETAIMVMPSIASTACRPEPFMLRSKFVVMLDLIGRPNENDLCTNRKEWTLWKQRAP